MDLVRINRHSGIGLTCPPFVQVFLSTLSSSQTPASLPSASMEGENQHLPAQTTKPLKIKSKQSTSSFSQNIGVVKTKKSKTVGSVKLVSKGEETRDNLQIQKHKEGGGVPNQASHYVHSQKGTDVSIDSNKLRLAPSQKGVNIEKDPQPRTHDKGIDTNLPPLPKMFKEERNCFSQI